MGGGGGPPARGRGGRDEARARPADDDRARSRRVPARGHRDVRAGRAGAHGPAGRHARGRRRSARGRGADAGVRAAGLARAARQLRGADARRGRLLQPFRAAPGARGLRSGLRARVLRGQRLRRGLESRRQGGQERDRLRHGEAPGGGIRHAVRPDRDHPQDDAEAGDGLHARPARALRRGGDPCAGSRLELAVRGFRRRSPARSRRAPVERRRDRVGIVFGHPSAHRGPAPVRRLSRRRARSADRARRAAERFGDPRVLDGVGRGQTSACARGPHRLAPVPDAERGGLGRARVPRGASTRPRRCSTGAAASCG